MRIWYYPDSTRDGGGGVLTVETIDLGEYPGSLEPYADEDRYWNRAVDGSRTVVTSDRAELGVEWRHQAIAQGSRGTLIRKLRSLEAHLLRGGTICLAGDEDRAWAGYPTSQPVRGDASIRTTGNPWSGLTGVTSALSSGDVVCVSSASPEGFRSYHAITSLTTTTGTHRLALDDEIVYSPRLGCLVRHELFYPALILDSDRQGGEPIITSREGRHRVWDVTAYLVEDTATIAASRDVPDGGFQLNGGGDNQGYSF